LLLCQKLGILKYISPTFERGVGVMQNQAHKFDVWEHNLRSLQHAADKKWPFHIRLAALFHDISKPETRRWSEEKKDWTFYGHDVVGSRVTRETLKDLRFPKDTIDLISKMVRWHMFFSDTEQITLSAVRRLIANIGKENVWDLMDLRVCDRIGTGRPKENPYRLRKYKSMVEEAMRDPVSVGMLKIDGKRLMEVTHEIPGPRIGNLLHTLLEEVLEDPTKNTAEYLENRALEVAKLPEEELRLLGEKGKEKKEEEDEKLIEGIRKRHWVE
jgi:putative nucleotidyltransferase with HDIG domain